MCFAPPRRALFQHLHFHKYSENGVLCTFWLRNMLCATTACTFGTSQLPSDPRIACFVHFDFDMCFAPQQRALFQHQLSKVLQQWRALYILTVQFFISHLPRWLRTRRCSEPNLTFRSHKKLSGKTQWFATFLPFRAPASPFFWLFPFSDLLPSQFLWLFPPLLFHLSTLSEVWLLNFLN